MMALVGDRVRLATREIAGVVVHVATPAESHPARRDWLRITVHGGGLVYMGGSYARAEAGLVALQSGCEAWSVDYRMPPDHPYPASRRVRRDRSRFQGLPPAAISRRPRR